MVCVLWSKSPPSAQKLVQTDTIHICKQTSRHPIHFGTTEPYLTATHDQAYSFVLFSE